MLVVCSYCHKTIREDASGRSFDVSHGMCPGCADHFERLWRGMSLHEYLDELPQPVLVVNGEGRIVAVNQQLASLFGKDRADMRGLLGGEALACVHSRLPEGCGKTIHCRECTIRRAVTQVTETGRPLERIPAYLKTAQGRIDLRITVKAKDGLVKVLVDEMKPAPEVVAQA